MPTDLWIAHIHRRHHIMLPSLPNQSTIKNRDGDNLIGYGTCDLLAGLSPAGGGGQGSVRGKIQDPDGALLLRAQFL